MLPKDTGTYRTTIILAVIAVCHLLAATSSAAAVAKIDAVRVGRHPTFTRLVFDIEGPRPSRISPLSHQILVITYAQLRTRVRPTRLTHRLRKYVSKVVFSNRRGRSSIRISCRPHTAVRYFFLSYNPPKPHWYRMVIDFSPEAAKLSRASDRAAPTEATSRSKTKKPRPPARPEPTAAISSTTPPPPALTAPTASTAASPAPAVGTRSAGNLYQIANRTFLEHQDNLPQNALTIIDAYQAALNQDPQNPQVPLALYRSALAYSAIGDSVRAETYWRKVVLNYPQTPYVGLCWFNIGHIDWKRKNYLKAILAFRNALAQKLDSTTEVELHYELGECLAAAEHHQQAVDNYQKCLDANPKYYLQKPHILKLMGVSWFVLHKYAQSIEYLLHYLNLQDQAPDRDIVLTRIADALRHMDRPALADKLYGYVEKTFPDSEGCIISKIRKAESLEKQHGKASQKAYAIYKQLSGLPLSPPLRKLVFLKLASWEFEQQHYQKSLDLIEEVLRGRTDLAPYDGFLALKEQVVKAWAKQALAEKHYLKVIQLNNSNPGLFQDEDVSPMKAYVAKSYLKLQIYPQALAIYQDLLAKQKHHNPDYLFKAAQCSFLMNDLQTAKQYCARIPSGALQAERTLLLAQIDFAAKNYQKAAQQFGQLLKTKEGPATFTMDTRLQYAKSLIQLGKNQSALDFLQHSSRHLDATPTRQAVQLNLLQAQCYQNLKQPDKAIGAVEQALALTSSKDLTDQLNYQLASLYISTKQTDKATAKLTALVQSGGPFWKTAAQQELSYLKVQNASIP